MPSESLRVGYVLKVFPRLSQTFIVNELRAHEAAGLSPVVFSLRSPRPEDEQIVMPPLRSEVVRLDATADEPVSQLAARVAREARARGLEHLHAHFGNLATIVARQAARRAGLRYSFTAHAIDIFGPKVDPSALRERLHDAHRVVTVSDWNARHLESTFGRPVERIYNGLPLDAFPFRRGARASRELLGVGRLVEKKGFGTLVEACARLRASGLRVACSIVGDGPLRASLSDRIRELGLEGTVRLLGARPPEEVRRRIAEAALLVAPCAVAGDGDRDGLPTVLIEAMALGTPVVSTPVTGIPELVRAGETGMSVPADDAAALARACAYLLGEPREVERLQVAARVHVERHFDARWTSAQLRSCFRVGGPRIVFRIHNRRGVGHWMRSHNIAREILALEPESEIVFLARGGAPFEPGDPRIRHVVAESGARPSLRELDRLGFAPDVVVDDTILPDERPEPGVRHVFVLRKRRREGLDSLVADGALDAVDRIIVPHGEDELGDCLPASLRRRLDFVGPIARAATAAGRARVRRAYGVGPGTRLLVSTPGGGGFREDVRRLVGIAGRVHDRLVGDDWRHVLVLGPNAVDEEAPRDERMIVVRSEPELPALLAEACCVISAAGYNTVQEIRLAGRPAVLLPGDRKYDDQTERAEAFARAGHGWCVDPTDAEAAATRIVACLEDAIGLARAEASLARSPLVVGNRAAAEVVLASGRDSRRVASSGAGATGDA